MNYPFNCCAITPPGTQDAEILANLELRYGQNLELMSREDKLAFRVVLCTYMYRKEFIDQYLIVDAFVDSVLDFDPGVWNFLKSLHELSAENVEALIRCITAQL